MSAEPNKCDMAKSVPFSSCEAIAAFYEKQKVSASQTVDVFGGRSYTWYLSEKEQPFQVNCACGVGTLGLGVLQVRSRLASDAYVEKWFRGKAVVEEETGKVSLKGALFAEHELKLPLPDKK